MVEGIAIFRARLSGHSESLILIGGAACDEWFSGEGLAFRATNDLDIVLVAEALNQDCVRNLRDFVREGRYEITERTEGTPILYRFAKPETPGFPRMLELFSRKPEGLDLFDDQTIVPIPAGSDTHSLSAILLDEGYYQLLLDHRETREGIAIATATALIPLKARAWLDFVAREDAGEQIDSRHLKKHRADVFRLAATLPDARGPRLAEPILADLREFLAAFPADSPDWPAILASIKPTVGTLPPSALIEATRTWFQL